MDDLDRALKTVLRARERQHKRLLKMLLNEPKPPVANAASFRKPPTVVNEKPEHKSRAKVANSRSSRHKVLNRGTGKLAKVEVVVVTTKSWEACTPKNCPVRFIEGVRYEAHDPNCPTQNLFVR